MTAIVAQPEPPEVFNVNVQALVYAVDTKAHAEVAVGEKFKNLNVQIAVAAASPSLDRRSARHRGHRCHRCARLTTRSRS